MAMQVVVTSAFGTSNHVQSLLSHLSSNSDAQFDLQHEILNMSGCTQFLPHDWQIRLADCINKQLYKISDILSTLSFTRQTIILCLY